MELITHTTNTTTPIAINTKIDTKIALIILSRLFILWGMKTPISMVQHCSINSFIFIPLLQKIFP